MFAILSLWRYMFLRSESGAIGAAHGGQRGPGAVCPVELLRFGV